MVSDNLIIEVLPLVYNALESEHAAVQEKALKAVPDLCETIDYAEVQSVLFPRVAVRSSLAGFSRTDGVAFQLVFSKTKVLSVKVATLFTFLTMVKTLDTVGAYKMLYCLDTDCLPISPV